MIVLIMIKRKSTTKWQHRRGGEQFWPLANVYTNYVAPNYIATELSGTEKYPVVLQWQSGKHLAKWLSTGKIDPNFWSRVVWRDFHQNTIPESCLTTVTVKIIISKVKIAVFTIYLFSAKDMCHKLSEYTWFFLTCGSPYMG